MAKSKFIDHTNKKWFWSLLNNENEVAEVCKYLADNTLKIEIRGDGAGGWNGNGISVLLEDIDLSGNGFYFCRENLLLHVRCFRKLKEISNTDDFKNWLEKYQQFDLVRRYIIEKDQRWITEDKINL